MHFSAAIQSIILFLPLLSALPILPRLSLADTWSSYYERDYSNGDSYNFGYDLEDPDSGNVQFRQEERFPNGTVSGSYGFLEPDGNIKIAHYTADNFGYRVHIENSNGSPKNYPPITMPLEEYKEQDNSYETFPSNELLSAIDSTMIFGQSVQEQHTPPKYYNQFDEWSNNIENRENQWNNYYDMNSFVYK